MVATSDDACKVRTAPAGKVTIVEPVIVCGVPLANSLILMLDGIVVPLEATDIVTIDVGTVLPTMP